MQHRLSISARRALRGAFVPALLAVALPAVAVAADCSPTAGAYTPAQAQAGKTLYQANCAECHNDDLLGNSGPALAGKDFDSYLHFSKMSAPQLLDFIKSQMPYQAPGSLKTDEYTKIFAYMLQVNGYKSGDQELSDASVKCVSMLPYPGEK